MKLSVEQQIVGLNRASRDELLIRWRSIAGRPAPKYASRSFLMNALAYELQCKAKGGMSSDVKRALKQVTGSTKAVAIGSDKNSTRPPVLAAGTRLVREWNGRTYQVEASDGGFIMDGKKYQSLSAIARRITGAKWSGPRFFGLAARRSNPTQSLNVDDQETSVAAMFEVEG